MKSLYAKWYVLAGALTAMPLLELELLDWLKGIEGRTFFSQALIQLLTGLVAGLVQMIMNGLFGVA